MQLQQGNKQEYYGARYKVRGQYNSGGCGYVLSWTKLGDLVRSFNMSGCRGGEGGAEDVNIGGCLRQVCEVLKSVL